MTAGDPQGAPDAVFDAEWYLAHYPDVAAEGIDPWRHFRARGEAEGRSPGPDFDTDFYRRTYLSLEGDLPVRHYILHGRRRRLRRRPMDASAAQSSMAMHSALRGLTQPVLLVGNDTQRAGAPIALLAIARRLRDRGMSPVFIVSRAGPLLDAYRALGPTLIAEEGWDLSGLGSAVPDGTPVIGSTGWAAPMLDELAVQGPTVLLVQEMLSYLQQHGLTDALSARTDLIVAVPSSQRDLEAVVDPATRIHTIVPGLDSTLSSPLSRARVRRSLAAEFGRDRIVFLGAGYADHRKGFDLFLAAATAISVREPRARFVWLGEASGWAAALAAEAIGRGLPLLMPGFSADARAWYLDTAVYLLTSRQDPGPTTVVDAARAGVPFVAYSADIGLRSLGAILDGVGEFVDGDDEFVERALNIARVDTTAKRRWRARHIQQHSSFGAYVDAIWAVLLSAGQGREAEPLRTRHFARVCIRLSSAARRAFIRAGDGALEFVGRARAITAVKGRQASFARLAERVGPPPITVAVSQSGAPQNAIATPTELARLQPGDTAWLASPGLVAFLARPTVLHLVRDDQPPWPLIDAVQSTRGFIVGMRQHPQSALPEWALDGNDPPRGGGVIDYSGPTPYRAHALADVSTSPRLDAPVGVFLHAYYLDLMPRIIGRLNLLQQASQLYVSTDDDEKAAHLRRMLPGAQVRVFENRGRDVFPKFYGWPDAYREHNIVLHLHTKRSPQAEALTSWLDFILERLLPSPSGIDAILTLFAENPTLGLVGPSPLPLVQNAVGWGPNRALAEIITWGHGWPELPTNDRLRFPAGSMFWGRTAALRPLLDLDLPAEIFTESSWLRNGTVAHALERLIGVSSSAAGFEQLFVDLASPAGGGRRATTESVAELLSRS